LSGLFQRALDVLNHNHPSVPEPDDTLALSEEAGISKEDQKEILAEIDKVAQASRITVSPETMTLKAAKKGFVFPLAVNLMAVLLLAAGGFTLYTLFQRGQTVLMEEGSAITTAEGMLIQELKKESEAKILEKNREISQIQTQLQSIDQQRRDLQMNMDARVKAREEELRAGLEAELAAERDRLRQQGISEQDISTRLKQLEADRNATFQAQLDAFRRQAEEERTRAENNLKSLQAEYESSLAQANRERQQVVEAAKAREAELQSQLDARARTLEQESQQARQELNRLSEQRDKEQLAGAQLSGFYGKVKQDMEGGRLEQAVADLEGIRRYLDDPAVATLPSMLQRREIELFVVDSLASLVAVQSRRSEADTSSLIAAVDLLTELKSRVLEGEELARSGQVDQAEVSYRQALALIPEVSRAHAYLLDRAAEAERQRRDTLRGYLQRAEAAFARKDYAGALEAYTSGLAYLPEQQATVDRLVSQVREAGYQLGLERLRREDSGAASAPLARANELFNQGDYAGAVGGYLEVLARYPTSTQSQSAVSSIAQSVRALEQRAGTSAGDTAALRSSLEAKTREVEELKGRLAASQSGAGERQNSLQDRVGELEQELSSRVALIETLQKERAAMEQQVSSLKADIERLRGAAEAEAAAHQAETEATAKASAAVEAELEQKVARLQRVEQRYQKLVDGYQEYASREDALLQGRGETALTESKLYLNAFLAASEEMLPGLWERIKRYDEAFEKAGRSSAIQDVSDILYELSLRDRPEARQLLLQSEQARYRGDGEMQALLEDLLKLFVP
jgi:hypothetical protein